MVSCRIPALASVAGATRLRIALAGCRQRSIAGGTPNPATGKRVVSLNCAW
jgi:hypothetical protein